MSGFLFHGHPVQRDTQLPGIVVEPHGLWDEGGRAEGKDEVRVPPLHKEVCRKWEPVLREVLCRRSELPHQVIVHGEGDHRGPEPRRPAAGHAQSQGGARVALEALLHRMEHRGGNMDIAFLWLHLHD